MTDPSYGVTPGDAWPPPGPPTGPPPPWPSPVSKQSRAPVVVSLVVALVAVAIAIGSWFRPSPEAPPAPELTPAYSDQQVADSKEAMCSAYDKIYNALKGAGTQTSDDPTQKFIIAVNIRLATLANSNYLTQALSDNPATPSELTATFRDMKSAYNEIVLAQLANAPQDELDSINAKLDKADSAAYEACK